MTEFLFQLQKAGQFVGYLRIKDGRIQVRHAGSETWQSPYWLGRTRMEQEIDFDEARPFICRDRHGQSVFEGDDIVIDGNRRELAWDETSLGWIVNDGRPLHTLLRRIELIRKDGKETGCPPRSVGRKKRSTPSRAAALIA